MKNKMKWLLPTIVFFSVYAVAQNNAEKINETSPVDAKKTESVTEKTTDKSSPKMIQSANFNLSTTITGNQEQPKVLYILPWQSPQTDNVDFEMLDNQQKAVFGHLEREELRREIEFVGDTQ